VYIGLQVKYRKCCQILIQRVFSRQILKKYLNIRLPEYPSNGSRGLLCGHRQADMTKLTVAFRNVANAPKKGCLSLSIFLISARGPGHKKVITYNPLKLAQVHTAHLRRTQQFPHVVSTFCALALHIRGTESCAQLTDVQERYTVCISASVAVFPSSHCFFLLFCCCMAVCFLYILLFPDLGWLFHLHFIFVRTRGNNFTFNITSFSCG